MVLAGTQVVGKKVDALGSQQVGSRQHVEHDLESVVCYS